MMRRLSAYGAAIVALSVTGCGSGDEGSAAAPGSDAAVRESGGGGALSTDARAPYAGIDATAETSGDAAVETRPSEGEAGPDVLADVPAATLCPTPMPPQSGGQTYYIAAQGGSDSNTGLSGNPFATLQKAASNVAPGDTVVVEDGTYTSSNEAVLSVTTGGTSSNYVVFRARNRWGAKIDGRGQTALGINFAAGIGYVRIEGFEITGVTGPAGAGGINCNDGGNDVQIVGNHIHDVGRSCTDTVYGLDAIFIRQPRITIEQNLIHDIGRYAPGENGCSPAQPYYQNHDHGVYVDGDAPGASDATIRNNVFRNCARGWAVQLYPGTLSNLRIEHNTFVGQSPYRDGQVLIYGITLSGSVIRNNVFLDPRGAAISVGGGPTVSSTTVSHNLTNVADMLDVGTQAGITLTGNVTSQDPKVVDATSGDYHLGAGSPAVDMGETVSDVTNDFDGTCRPRGGGYDIGAFER